MGKLAFLFAGQGAQYTGMGLSLYESSPAAASVFHMADRERPGTSRQCFTASREELTKTQLTQPTIFCVDLAAAMALREKGMAPDYLAGFSLGEIPALAFGGYLDFKTAFGLTLQRARFMEECAEKNGGAMFAVAGLDPERVEELACLVPGCWPANYNSRRQTVISCTARAAEEVPQLVKDAGGRALRLRVSGAFHSPLMDNAARALSEAYPDLRFDEGKTPVISNLTADIYDCERRLFDQINSPVRWNQSIQRLLELGVDRFVEVGPGRTLSGLMAKIEPGARVYKVEDAKTLDETLEALC